MSSPSPTAAAPVEIVMGSASDYPVMAGASSVLDELQIPTTLRVVSAHRTPHTMVEYGRSAGERGVQVIVAGAGGAAHLPGMLASLTTLPVIGVPVPTRHLGGVDSLLSIVQMPTGVPVATVAIGAAGNAGLLAARILALSDPALASRLAEYAHKLAALASSQDLDLRTREAAAGTP